jgi:hypothetical protein
VERLKLLEDGTIIVSTDAEAPRALINDYSHYPCLVKVDGQIKSFFFIVY